MPAANRSGNSASNTEAGRRPFDRRRPTLRPPFEISQKCLKVSRIVTIRRLNAWAGCKEVRGSMYVGSYLGAVSWLLWRTSQSIAPASPPEDQACRTAGLPQRDYDF